MTRRLPGPLYESHYVKANSPDGRRAIWLKHTLLCAGPNPEDRILELWAMAFALGEPPVIAKTEIPWAELQLGPGPTIACSMAHLEADRAWGQLSDIRWDLGIQPGLGVLRHLPWRWLYAPWVPTAKVLTPETGLTLIGVLQLGAVTWDLENWVGLRGHNWGRDHAHRYGWLAVNHWEDSKRRSLEGFTACPRPGWPHFKRLVLHTGSKHGRLGLGGWTRSEDHPTRLVLPFSSLVAAAEAEPEDFVALRYRSPTGGSSICRCTKFARVELRHRDDRYRSLAGELEFIDNTRVWKEATHPPKEWSAADGVYRSER